VGRNDIFPEMNEFLTTSHSSCFSLLVFKCQHFTCEICLTFTWLMMRWKMRK